MKTQEKFIIIMNNMNYFYNSLFVTLDTNLEPWSLDKDQLDWLKKEKELSAA